jgi:xylulokinase
MSHSVSSHTVLGIDLGTSGVKCMLMDADGRVRGAANCPYPTSHPQTGWAEQNPADWCEAVAVAISELREREPALVAAIGAVGLCSAAHIPVLLDRNDDVVRPAILWSDQRSEVQVQQLNAEHGDLLERVALNRAGCTWTLPQLLWLRACEPQNYARARSLLCSKDFLLWKLTGVKATDLASAAAMLMADVPARRWSDDLAGLAALPAGALPPILSTFDEAGRVTAGAADAFGLPAGVPVFVGTLDSAAELIGCGVIEPQTTGMIMVGSSGGVMALADRPSHHTGIITYPHVVDDFYYKQAGTNSCATSLQWIRTLFSTVPGHAVELGFADLDDLAAHAEAGAGGLLFHPYLQGERAPYWNPELRGSFSGIDQTHTSAHFVRAVMEGVAYSLKDCLAMFERNGLTMKSAVIAGGVAKSRVWTQIITDVLGLETYTTANGESAFGACLLAATAKGTFAGLKEAIDICVRRERTLVPDRNAVERYAAGFARYRTVAAFYDRLCRAA